MYGIAWSLVLIAKVDADASVPSHIAPLPELYLQTLVGALTGEALRTRSVTFEDAHVPDYDSQERAMGRIGCLDCLTMLGSQRLRDIWDILDLIRGNVLGDFVQAGVWRGGVSIFARAYFHVYNMDRKVFACDSFEGFPDDANYAISNPTYFDVSEDIVAQNFKAFGLLDENVQLIAGFFNESLAGLHDRMLSNSRRISLLHLDADLYSSYMDILFNLYDLVEIGGYIVCDDCGFIEEAGRAVTDFRLLHNIHAPLQVWQRSKLTRYWQKTAEVQIDLGTYQQWNHQRHPWGLLRCAHRLEFDALWHRLESFTLEMVEPHSADLQDMMKLTLQHLESQKLVIEFLNGAILVLLEELSLSAVPKQEHFQEGLFLAQACAETALDACYEMQIDGDDGQALKARKLLDGLHEARVRLSLMTPQYNLTLIA